MSSSGSHRLTALQKARLHLAQRAEDAEQSPQQQQLPPPQTNTSHARPTVSSGTQRTAAAGRGAEAGGGRFSAAKSHEQNDKYMEDFDRAWEEMHNLHVGSRPVPSASSRAALPQGTGVSSVGAAPSSAAQPRLLGPRSTSSAQAAVARVASGTARAQRTGPPASGSATLNRYPAMVVPGWRSGPGDTQGVACDLSDRPTICSAANWSRGEVVLGSSDHALYVVDAAKGTKKRTLYTKTCGHSEWVTCVSALPDGRVVSGGMDSRLWLWPAGGTRGMEMAGHSGAVSQVEYDASSGHVLSSSYDKTVRMWQVGARGCEVAVLTGHTAPVLELQVAADGRAASGDRGGTLMVWDTSAANVSFAARGAHEGHVTAVAWWDGAGPGAGLVVSGGQDGCVCAWDCRSRAPAAKVQLHVNSTGRGAVGDICAGGPAACGLLVTAGADGTLRVLDPAKGFALQSTVKLTNFPYSLAVAGGLALAGCGDGSVHVVDIRAGRTLYALGANAAAVRTIEACSDRLLCSGDDGNSILYTFL